MTITTIDAQLAQLDRSEKARVFQRLALDLVEAWPRVEKTPGVQGGDALRYAWLYVDANQQEIEAALRAQEAA